MERGRRADRRPAGARGLLSTLAAGCVVTLLLASCGPTDDAGAGQAAEPRKTTRTSVTPTTGTPGPQTDDVEVDRLALSRSPAFASAPWADALRLEQDEFELIPRVDGASGSQTNPEFAGRYTNVVDGVRRTAVSSCTSCPEHTMWLFGGPVAFGLGQRDGHTVASALVALAADRGLQLEVLNFGVPGATVVDEVEALEARIATAEAPPDLVVFLDGLNDALATYMFASVRDGDLLDPVRFDDAWVEEYLAIDPAPDMDQSTVDRVARHVAAQHRESQSRATAVLGRVPSIWFLQPDGFVSVLQSNGLARSLGTEPEALAEASGLARLLDAVEVDLGTDVVSTRPTIAALDQEVYADTLHLNEHGARVVAEAMFPAVEAQLR